MSRTENIKIGKETLQIIRQGYYMYHEERMDLAWELRDYRTVQVITPEKVKEITADQEGFFKSDIFGPSRCEYQVVNMDSFQAAYEYSFGERCLVMNFANAHVPGGGFLHGAGAQEESLCRCSTLYASLASKRAEEMYQYNNEHPHPYDSDYMLITPHVEVFRQASGELREDSFVVSVLTIPAPNLNGAAHSADPEELEREMKRKIRNFLLVATKGMYKCLVLGAWGCGAFGHDAKKVAGYFEEILVSEKYYRFFEKVIFAVYDQSPDQYNYDSFHKVIGEHGLWKEETDESALIRVYFEEGTVDEAGNDLLMEEAIADNAAQREELVHYYLEEVHGIADLEVLF